MTLLTSRTVVALLGLAFVAIVAAVVYAAVNDDPSSPSDAPTAQVTSPNTADGDQESAPPSGSVGRTLAGFALIGGWSIGVVATLFRAGRRRQRSTTAQGATPTPTRRSA